MKNFEKIIAGLIATVHNPITWVCLLGIYGVVRVLASSK